MTILSSPTALSCYIIILNNSEILGFTSVSMVENLPAMEEIQVCSLGQEDPLEKKMSAHSSILAWKIPWTGKQVDYGELQKCLTRLND